MILLLLLLWIPIASMMSGAVLETFWYWFVIPLGAPDITIAHAMGLSLMVNFLTFKHEDDDRTATETLLSAACIHLVALSMFLLFGYIIKSYM